MDWKHESSLSWMLARRDVITASELRSCLSAYNKATKDQKAGNVLLPAFAALWLEKQAVKVPDTYSRGSAARGHILEPYAISDYNDNIQRLGIDAPIMHHWDDAIVKRGGVGWSPDGMDIPQEVISASVTIDESGTFQVGDRKFSAGAPKEFIEVKSYEPTNHMKRFLTPKEKLDERWQMAVAFHVVDTMDKGIILFYSIETDFTFQRTYMRDELSEEIEQIGNMVDLWNANVAILENIDTGFVKGLSEQEIYDIWIEDSRNIMKL